MHTVEGARRSGFGDIMLRHIIAAALAERGSNAWGCGPISNVRAPSSLATVSPPADHLLFMSRIRTACSYCSIRTTVRPAFLKRRVGKFGPPPRQRALGALRFAIFETSMG